jgi:hypothetical protein
VNRCEEDFATFIGLRLADGPTFCIYCGFEYWDLAAMRMRMSGSAPFQSVRKSWSWLWLCRPALRTGHFICLAVSRNEWPFGNYGRIITSFGLDGSVNLAPRSWFSFRVPGTSKATI